MVVVHILKGHSEWEQLEDRARSTKQRFSMVVTIVFDCLGNEILFGTINYMTALNESSLSM